MPSTTDTDSIILGVAAFLFAFSLIALIARAFKTFVLTGRSGPLARARSTARRGGKRHRSMDTASSSSSAATRWSI